MASSRDHTEMGYDDWMQPKALLKPGDQLVLTDAELKEEFNRVLTADNPHAPQNIIRYNFKDGTFKQLPHIDQIAVHFKLDSNLLHKDSDEARRQLAKEGLAGLSEQALSEISSAVTMAKATHGEGEDKPEEAPVAVKKPRAKKPEAKPANQFNFSERASQTFNNPLRERAAQTEPPPRANYTANATQWVIFDAYMEDLAKQEKLKEKKGTQKKDGDKKKKMLHTDPIRDDFGKVSRASKIVERMINQNTYDDIVQDFKYWEDTSDEFRDQEGTLLPLWRFTFEKAKRLAVTALAWNTKYYDMFAVGHGSYDYLKPTKGLVLVYSLKNPSFPEYTYETDSGVMSLDFHKDYPYLICTGFYDGSVGVYNLLKPDTAQFMCTAKGGKHTDPVWQVKWQKDDIDNNLNFFSISSDGRVCCWALIKTELNCTDIIQLKLEENKGEASDTSQLIRYFCGTSFDFHSSLDYLFLVGTEEGRVHKCSKAYKSQYLDTIPAHHMAVYKIHWNFFHPKIYITCSADWTIKIWDHSYHKKEPMFVFDLNSSVGDVSWAPYSSTVFAAVTADGKVHVFDLNVNKYEPICEQLVVSKKKTKLTHISFNPKHPIVIVGDDRGYTTSLKLSPNLRKQPKEKKGLAAMTMGANQPSKEEYEIGKMDKLLSLVKEPGTEKQKDE